MAGQKNLREFSVFLVILVFLVSEGNVAEASLSPGVSPSISTSVSQSTSTSANVSQSTSSSANASASTSSELVCVCSTPWSSSLSASTSPSISANVSQSNSTSANVFQPTSTSVSAFPSISANVSQSNSTSANVSTPSTPACSCYFTTLTGLLASESPSTSTSVSVSASIPASTTPSISTSVPPSISTSTTPSISTGTTRSIPASVPPPISTSTTPSISTSTTRSIPASVPRPISTSTTPSISTGTTRSIPASVSPPISTSTTPSISTSTTPSISTSTTPSISTSVPPSIPASVPPPISTSTTSSISASVPPPISTSTTPSNSANVSQSTSSSANVSTSISTDSIQPTSPFTVHLSSTAAPDPCSSFTCQNGGTCQNVNGTAECICAPGFNGSNCEQDPCSSFTCDNGGTCQIVNVTAECICAPGFNGSNCEQDIDECASSPCQNNGTCVDGINSFSCNCSVGFLGETCSFADPCLQNPCRNNGTCYVDAAKNYTFFCVCPIPKAYTGQDCGTPVQCFWDIMYPYGKEQGDQEMAAEVVKERHCSRVSIDTGLYFFGRQHYEVFICANGMLSFDAENEFPRPIPTYKTNEFPFKFAMLTPYWSKIDHDRFFCLSPENCHVNYANRSIVFYQVYKDISLTQNTSYILENASKEVRHNQPEAFGNFSAKWVLVVTWLRLRPDDTDAEEGITNTFQAVLITNGTYTFVKYHYPCGAVQWSVPKSFEGVFRDSFDGYPVAGYNAGDKNTDDPKKRYPSLDGSGSYNVKNLDDKAGNTGRRGEYCFRIEDRKGDDASTKCNAWRDLQEKELKNDVDFADARITSCPCSWFQIIFDTRFYSTSREMICFNSLITSFIFKDVNGDQLFAAVQRRCCYSNLNGLIGALEVESSFLKVFYFNRPGNFLDDDTAERLCLVESNNEASFHAVRPVDDCSRYRPIRRIWFFGDPHFLTLDGKNYTFNGVGEYTMVTANYSAFVLQARTKVAQGGLNTATVFSAGVAKEDNTSKVEVRIKSGGGLEMYIDGSLYAEYNTLNNISKDIGGNLRAVKKSTNCVEVSFKTGTGVEFCEAKEMLSIVVTLSEDYFNNSKGLLGTYNRNPEDDFTLPNGTVLPPSMTSKQIHYNFGLNWQITAEESLFTYGPNENVSTFMNKSFIPMFVEDIVWADNNTKREAERGCGDDAVCLFDAASTNDVSVGLNSQAVSVKLVEENKQMDNFPPKFTYVPDCIEATLGNVSFVNVTASDNNSFTFNVLNKPNGASFNVSGNQLYFTWNVTSSEKVKFTFVATDELNASVISTPCIKMCACINGSCVAPKPRDNLNNDSKFIYQGCSCSAGYTGRFCESDIDACALNGQPCFKGVTCTDQPAPANITGYTCGSCPSGYSGDGVKCVDINECENNSSNCSQICTNTPGSFVCSCELGFQLNSNKLSCDDINECEPTNDCMHQCNNTIGNYTCFCNDLFVVNPNDSKSCIPSKQCPSNKDCNQICYIKEDNITQACDCNSGYQLGNDGKTCADIDECKIPGIKCTQKCNNSDGGYKCECFSGYKLEADGFTCTDINECLDSNLFSCPGEFRVCENIPGSYKCKCHDGLYFINDTCTALKPGEVPPTPTVPPPKDASEEERQNSVELRLTNMRKEQYNVTIDENLKQTMAQSMNNYCDQDRAACGITSKRRRRSLSVFSANNVHLVPGFPIQDNSFLRIAFYVLQPGGAVIPVATLLQAVNNSKSELETLFGVPIAEIKLGFIPTSPPTTQTPTGSNVTTVTSATSPTTGATTVIVTEEEDDDWKWIVIGVVIGLVVIVGIIVVACVVIKKKKQGKVGMVGNGEEHEWRSSPHDENLNRDQERHEMMTYQGQQPGQPLV